MAEVTPTTSGGAWPGTGPLRAGAALLVLVGAARSLGGIILILHGRAADPAILAGPSTVLLLGAILAAVGVLGILSGIGAWRRNRLAWIGGIGFSLLFVLDGLLNGWLLFGAPRPIGTLSNAIVVAVTLALLVPGRRALSHAPSLPRA